MHLLDNLPESLSSCIAPVVKPVKELAALEAAFGVPFVAMELTTGNEVARADSFPSADFSAYWALCSEVARRGRPELIAEEGPLMLLAVPLPESDAGELVALALFVSRLVSPNEHLASASAAFSLQPKMATAWAVNQRPWSPNELLRTAALIYENLCARQRIARLENEARLLSSNINSTYEEISLLHRLTQNLRLSQSDEELGRIALAWLDGIVPAKGMAIHLTPAGRSETMGSGIGPAHVFQTHGDCPIDDEAFRRLARHAAETLATPGQPLVLNERITSAPEWPCPEIRQAIFVPLAEGKHHFGWMAALNHLDDGEFGSGEASLMNSVAVILGIHSGNILLYQQQADLTAGIIRALTEAIDARDQYTCGHSDRVARIAVRLAQEMGCDLPTINTIYLAGLLHDIGKIGITDEVLRKPGKLTAAEYEHIKTHPTIGHRILRDIKKLDQILPIILHHHESWNGAGYPQRLAAEEIPLAARIVAVADSYDAMGSDRPYRKGLPEEKIDEIFRTGSGLQWDPDVVAAFFRAKDDLHQIVNDDRRELLLDLRTWPG